MTVLLGEYALSGAMLTALAIVMAAVGYWQLKNDGLLRAMRWGMALLAGLLCVSSWGLLKALLDNNFALAYVVEHSERALPWGFKLAAFWAGQQGSMLFWAWVLGLMGVLLAWRLRKVDGPLTAVSLATMAAVIGFFTCIMLFATNPEGQPAGNPFFISPVRHTDGQGLNAQLQTLAMVAHPPALFLGYAGFTVPFALMLGGFCARQTDGKWLAFARPWMVFSWITLTVGIVLGAQWAYMELGWGGYWAWDPVENASLFPWLTGTALLHSAVLQTKRGIFKHWTAWLTAASFLLCVLGTYLTRSGVINSVHGFPQSSIGDFFLVFMGMISLTTVVAILLSLPLLKSARPLEAVLSQEGFFMTGNVLLVVMTLTTLVGTLYPLISGVFGPPVTVDKPFYNAVVLPMALLLAGLMATGPVLGSGPDAWSRARGKLGVMLIAGIVAAVAVGLWDYKSVGGLLNAWGTVAQHFALVIWSLIRMDKAPIAWPAGVEVTWLWMQVAALAAAAVLTGIAFDIFTSLRTPHVAHDPASAGPAVAAPNLFQKLSRTLIHRQRHWGAQIAHVGLAAIVVGVAGSSVYGHSKTLQLHPSKPSNPGNPGTPGNPGNSGTAEDRKFANYTLELGGLDEIRRANHTAMVATVTLKGADESFQLKPEHRFYDVNPEQGSTEVALRPGLFSDVYMTLAGWENNGSTVSVTVMINPLVNWIWIGGALLTLGGLVCMIPTTRKPVAVPAPETAAPPVVLTGKNKRQRERARATTKPAIAGRH